MGSKRRSCKALQHSKQNALNVSGKGGGLVQRGELVQRGGQVQHGR